MLPNLVTGGWFRRLRLSISRRPALLFRIVAICLSFCVSWVVCIGLRVCSACLARWQCCGSTCSCFGDIVKLSPPPLSRGRGERFSPHAVGGSDMVAHCAPALCAASVTLCIADASIFKCTQDACVLTHRMGLNTGTSQQLRRRTPKQVTGPRRARGLSADQMIGAAIGLRSAGGMSRVGAKGARSAERVAEGGSR